MKAKYVNIVSFDIPFPANYGGVIDVYYKLVALHTAGVHIILHCFEYGERTPAPVLLDICDEVYYYKRNTNLYKHIHVLPYSIWSRKNQSLIDNLCKNDYPILFEGLMSCYYLNDKRLANRIKIYREVNIEHEYYFQLAAASTSFIKKCFFYLESAKLRFFQKQIAFATRILAVSTTDKDYLKKHFPNKDVRLVPCFHDEKLILPPSDVTDYILYHGNLAVSENENAAIYLCKNVFSELSDIRCVIAGRKPSERLIEEVKQYAHIELMADVEQSDMEKLICDAQVHLLVTFQGTGLKLKLLNVLTAGKHIVANSTMLTGTDLDSLCHIADTAEKQVIKCKELIKEPFNSADMEIRKQKLAHVFSNEHITQEVLSALFDAEFNLQMQLNSD